MKLVNGDTSQIAVNLLNRKNNQLEKVFMYNYV